MIDKRVSPLDKLPGLTLPRIGAEPMNVHYAQPGQIGSSYTRGQPLQALCGTAFTPTIHNAPLDVCTDCEDQFNGIHPRSVGRPPSKRARAGEIQRNISAVG